MTLGKFVAALNIEKAEKNRLLPVVVELLGTGDPPDEEELKDVVFAIDRNGEPYVKLVIDRNWRETTRRYADHRANLLEAVQKAWKEGYEAGMKKADPMMIFQRSW